MKKLTNSYKDFEMINLSWAPEGKGPYLVRQTAYSPSDKTMTDKPFILQNDGKWILSYHLVCLPEAEQETRLFSSTKEMLAMIDRIGSEDPVVIDWLPEGVTNEEALQRFKSSVARIWRRMESAKAEAIPR